MRHLMILGGLLVLGACGDGEVANDVPATNATAIANVSTPAAASTATPATASAEGTGWTGSYDATFEDGTGTVKIAAPDADGRYKVDLDLGAPGCAGKADGLASPAGNTLVLTLDSGQDTRVCQIGITRDGDTLEIEERNCLNFHGASCSFTGSALRSGSQPGAPVDQPGNASR